MPQSGLANSYADQSYHTRKPRNQKRPNYVLDESSLDILSLPTTPPQKRARTVPAYYDNSVSSRTRGGARAGAGRKKRSAPDLPDDEPTRENAPSPSALTLPTAPPKKKARTVLGERDNNVNGGRWGGLRDRAGRKQRSAADALTVDTLPETLVLKPLPSRPLQGLQHNLHLNGHTVIQRDNTPVNRNISVVTPPRDPLQSSPPAVEDVPEEIAPEPAPEYSVRQLRRHARRERTVEDRAEDRPTRRRGPYRRRNATDGGRTLGARYQLCRDPNAARDVELYTVHGTFNNASNTCPYCDAQSWPGERGTDNRWPCCDNGKNDWIPPDQSCKPEDVDRLPDGLKKERELMAREINNMLYEMDVTQVDGQPPVYRRTARSKEFIENIVSYNNCLSFTSEGTNNIDHNVGRTTFRIQGSVHHLMGPLMPDDGLKPKFAQIYTLDGTQEQLDTRQHYFDGLNQYTLALAQHCLRSINPYVQGFKNCYDRLKEDEEQYPIDKMSVRIQQLDPKRQSRGTHNRPTSTEVARVMITPADALKGRIERDIRVETKEGGLMSIPDWHPSYMALRYPLLFPFGEQSWHDRIPLAGHELPGDHPLHASRRNRTAGTLSRHTIDAFDDNPEGEYDIDPEYEEEPNTDGERAPRGCGGSIRLTRRQFYVKFMQVRVLSYPNPDRNISRSDYQTVII